MNVNLSMLQSMKAHNAQEITTLHSLVDHVRRIRKNVWEKAEPGTPDGEKAFNDLNAWSNTLRRAKKELRLAHGKQVLIVNQMRQMMYGK